MCVRKQTLRMVGLVCCLAVLAAACGKKDDDDDDDEDEGVGFTLEQCDQENGTSYGLMKMRLAQASNDDKPDYVRLQQPYLNDDPETIVPETRLPFPKGDKYEIAQGYGGRFSHNDDYGFYALDFAMDECSEIAAIAPGRVVAVREDSNAGGDSKDFANMANYVLIDHGQGGFGSYVHVCKDCVLVKPGQLVDQGQVVALSGTTGWSTGPHLHMQVNSWSSLNSYEKAYAEIDDDDGIPQEGGKYKSGNAEIEDSGAAFEGNESTIGVEAFAKNDVVLAEGLAWYKGLRKDKTTTITGSVTNSDGYVQIFLMDFTGAYLDGEDAAVDDDGNFSLRFKPAGSKLSGNVFQLALATKRRATDGVTTKISAPVYVGN